MMDDCKLKLVTITMIMDGCHLVARKFTMKECGDYDGKLAKRSATIGSGIGRL